MAARAGRRVLLDLASGLLAILGVVGVSVRASFVGSDMRMLFAMTALAFYVAGLARGRAPRRSVWLRGLLVSCPGLLGTAALIVNDGLHRLGIPIAISLTAILFTTAGLQTRSEWAKAPVRGVVLAAACLLLGLLEISRVPVLVTGASLHRVDRPAPGFTLATLDGRTLHSGELRGKTVVLAFWATWCLPCRWEMPELATAFGRIRDDSTVVFLAVDAAWGGETPERTRRFLARHATSLPVAFDPGGTAAALGVHALPAVLLIDRDGRVRYEHYGYDRSEHVSAVLLDCIRRLQREPAARGTG